MKEELKEKINEIKSEIDSLRPIDLEKGKKNSAEIQVGFGTTIQIIFERETSLTFGETKSFLLHGITANGKPLKDHLDIRGHNEAILILEDVVKDNRPLNENFIRELHQIILPEPYDNPAITPEMERLANVELVSDLTKNIQNHVITKTGEIFYFASPEETQAKMK
jgi:Fic family protein